MFKSAKKYNENTLDEFTKTLIEDMSLSATSQRAVDLMVTELDSCGGVFCITDSEKKTIQPLTFSSTTLVKKAIENLQIPFKKHLYDYDNPTNYLGESIKDKKIIQGEALSKFLAPSPNALVCEIMRRIVGSKLHISIPLISKDITIGLLLITFKETELSDEVYKKVLTFSKLVAAAIASSLHHEQLKKQYELVNEANIQTQSAQKFKSDLISMTSHELRNPLGVLSLAMEMIQKEVVPKLNEEEKIYIDQMDNSIERLKSILTNVTHLMETYNDEMKLKTDILNFVSLIDGVIKQKSNASLTKNISIITDIEKKARSKLLLVQGDIAKLKFVFWELLSNAVKWSKAGSQINVSVKIIRSPKAIQVKIEDTGCGIEPNTQKRILHKPFTTHENAENKHKPGLGIGLFLVKKIIKLHGGELNISSGKDIGTTVTFTIPMNLPQAKGTVKNKKQ